MSRENVELAAQVLDAVARRDLPRLFALTDADVEWLSFFAQLGTEGLYRGHDGLRQYVSDLDDSFDVVRPEVDEGIGVGDIVVLVGRVHFRGKASGVEGASAAGWMFKIRGGKVMVFRALRDPEHALEAVGLSD
jgi:ketosteroid isomerase-like protein